MLEEAFIPTEKQENLELSTITVENIPYYIYTVRNYQIMLDSDLATLFQVETKALNQAVKRNIERFPKEFCFQLTSDEEQALRSHFVTSNGRGGRRYLPYVFTEQGIAMLSAVLKSDIAIQVSIHIMNAFIEMRHFIANNAMMFECISKVELRQLEYEKETNKKLNNIFKYISNHEESIQKVFFDGQIYDAFSLISSLIRKAKTNIILIDGYIELVH